MEFFFCEKCGKRLTDQDIQAGKARHKQVKGVFCSNCAEGVMTVEFEAISPEMIDQFRKEQREKQRRATTPAAAAPPVPAPFFPPVRRPAPGSRPSIPVPSARRPTSGRMRPERPRFAEEGADPGAPGPSKKPLIAAVLAAVAVVMALALVFMRGGNAPAIKDRVEAPDVPLAPQETASAAVPANVPAKTSKPSESKASPAKTVAAAQPTYEGPTRTVELFSTDDVEDAKGAGEVYTDRPEIVVSTQPVSSGDLRFDLSKLGAVPVSAELTLYPSREPEAGSAVLVHRLSGMDWKETDFKEKRPKNRTRGSPVRAAIKSTGPVTVDVKPLVAAMPENETALTLHLQPDARKCNVAFGSREGPEATRPRLAVKIPDLAGTVAKPQTSPPPQAGDGAVYLADLNPKLFSYMESGTVEHAGQTYLKSLSSTEMAQHRTAVAYYALDGAYTVLRFDYAFSGSDTKTIGFNILCDGKHVWNGTDPVREVDLRGVNMLKLSVYGGRGSDDGIKGIWLSPRLYQKKSETMMPKEPEEAGAESPMDEGGEGAEAADPSIVAGSRTRLAERKSTSLSHLKVAGCHARDGNRYYRSLHTEGLAQNRECIATFKLDGQFGIFKTGFQVQPEGLKGLEVAVYRDGKQVPAPADNKWSVDVRGVKELKLVVSYPSGADPEAKAVWLDPTAWRVK